MPHTIHKINSYQVQANDEDAEMSGHLRMVQRKAWRKMWFVVKQKVLYTFKASEVRIEPSTCCMLPHSCKFSLLFGLNINLLCAHEERGVCKVLDEAGGTALWVRNRQKQGPHWPLSLSDAESPAPLQPKTSRVAYNASDSKLSKKSLMF